MHTMPKNPFNMFLEMSDTEATIPSANQINFRIVPPVLIAAAKPASVPENGSSAANACL